MTLSDYAVIAGWASGALALGFGIEALICALVNRSDVARLRHWDQCAIGWAVASALFFLVAK